MPTSDLSDRAIAVLDFWFGVPGTAEHGTNREEWFKKNSAFDSEIRQHFIQDYEAAAAGEYADWADTALGGLALLILLDQFPRNMFRDDPRTFATDALARDIAAKMLDQEQDQTLPPVQRKFVYLPFEHSENLDDQKRSVTLNKTLPGSEKDGSAYVWAQKHYDVIAKYGRFPHRNKVLGRPNTPEEDVYLAQPGAGF